MATRNIVPRANGEGNIGTSLKKWLKGWFLDVFVSGNLTDGTNNISVANAKDSNDKKHVQGTDAGLDTGGANAVTAVQLRALLASASPDNAHAESEAESTTTATAMQNKVTFNFTPAFTGEYKLDFCMDLTNSSAIKKTSWQVTQVGNILSDGTVEIDSINNQYLTVCGFNIISLTAGVATSFTIDFCRVDNTAKIKRARLAIRRAN